MITLYFLMYIVLGLFSGFIANLFGLGGGLIVVPCLVWVLPYTTETGQNSMHIAVATSLMIMLFNTAYASYLHFRKKNILLPIYRNMFLYVAIGALSGALFSRITPDTLLRYFYMTYLLYNLYVTLFRSQFFEKRTLSTVPNHNIPFLRSFSFMLGSISSLLGIGGGMLAIPFLRKQQLPMRYVTALSVTLALPVSLIGGVVYLMTGFIHWTACLGVSFGSFLGAKTAITLAPRIPDQWYAKLYVMLLCVIIVAMLLK